MTKRRSLSPMRRLAVFEKAGGLCHICSTRIFPSDPWEVEHIIPLALGGADEPKNMGPAHKVCHAFKTSVNAGEIARAKRRKAKHIGIKKPGTFPGGRQSKWKRKMDGSVVLR